MPSSEQITIAPINMPRETKTVAPPDIEANPIADAR